MFLPILTKVLLALTLISFLFPNSILKNLNLRVKLYDKFDPQSNLTSKTYHNLIFRQLNEYNHAPRPPLRIGTGAGKIPCRTNSFFCGFFDKSDVTSKGTLTEKDLYQRWDYLKDRTYTSSEGHINYRITFFHEVVGYIGDDEAKDSWLVGRFSGFDENGHMLLVQGDYSEKCGHSRNGIVVMTCAAYDSLFVYENTCQYQFTVNNPGACDTKKFRHNDNSSPKKLVDSSSYKFPLMRASHLHNYKKSFTIKDYEYTLYFFHQLILNSNDKKGEKEIVIGKFQGFDPFKKNVILLDQGTLCNETKIPRGGTLEIICSETEDFSIIEIQQCYFKAIYHDNDPGCGFDKVE